MNMKEIAMRVQQLRTDDPRHWAQKEVVAMLGISQSAYSDKENGHTAFTAVELDKLAEFYGKTLDELLHADRSVLNMHDRSSHGYIDNVIHALNVHGVSEELMTSITDMLQANTRAMERLAEQQVRISDLLNKH